MPIWLAVLSLVQGLSQSYHGNRSDGFASVFKAGQSLGQLFNSFQVDNDLPEFHSFGHADVGAKRNFM